MSIQKRAYVTSKFALVVDGSPNPGFVRAVDGGAIKTDITTYQVGAHSDLWRAIGKPKYEDISVQVGMGMSKPFYDWISDFFNRKITRKNGAILSADFDYKEQSRRNFYEALISEVSFPALDATNKEAGYLNVKIAPEWVDFVAGDGIKLDAAYASKQKLWSPANFRLQIEGLACGNVTKIDAFSIKQNILEDNVGTEKVDVGRRRTKVPGRIEWPNLTVYVPEAYLATWNKLHQEQVIKGKVKSPGLTGAITLMAPDMSTELMTISLFGIGIAGLSPDKADAKAESIRLWKADLHCERMTCEYHDTGTDFTTRSVNAVQSAVNAAVGAATGAVKKLF